MEQLIGHRDEYGFSVAKVALKTAATRYDTAPEILRRLEEGLRDGAELVGFVRQPVLGTDAAYAFHGLTDLTLAEAARRPGSRMFVTHVDDPKTAADLVDLVAEARSARAAA